MHNKVGVLMVNLGTPDAPTSPAVKNYLAQFLSDRRVIETSPLLWWPLLHAVILPFRASRLAKLYQSIWMEEGSPLLVYSQRQQKALAARRLPDVSVELGMSYGSPCLAKAIKKLLSQNLTKLIILPLYPQYSASTSAAVWDAVADILKRYRCLPSIHFIRDYAEHPAYIDALKQSVERSFKKQGQPDRLIVSFHGIPKRYAKLGDDYPKRCEDTYRALHTALALPENKMIMTYQSRFGCQPWLTPYTDKTLKKLPVQGVKHIQVICPGFAADCLETLEEIKQQNREIFLKAGGEKFEYISALNDAPAHIDLLEQLIVVNA